LLTAAAAASATTTAAKSGLYLLIVHVCQRPRKYLNKRKRGRFLKYKRQPGRKTSVADPNPKLFAGSEYNPRFKFGSNHKR
jgi:hypothetical protein